MALMEMREIIQTAVVTRTLDGSKISKMERKEMKSREKELSPALERLLSRYEGNVIIPVSNLGKLWFRNVMISALVKRLMKANNYPVVRVSTRERSDEMIKFLQRQVKLLEISKPQLDRIIRPER